MFRANSTLFTFALLHGTPTMDHNTYIFEGVCSMQFQEFPVACQAATGLNDLLETDSRLMCLSYSTFDVRSLPVLITLPLVQTNLLGPSNTRTLHHRQLMRSE